MYDIEEEYLFWLYSKIGNVEETRPSRTYFKLARQLHATEFVWFIANDDNRVEDGRYLRLDYLAELRISDELVNQGWLSRGCSVLEMLIALAFKIQFQAEFSVEKWFWEMLSNIGLSGCTDWRYNEQVVESIVQRLIWRSYSPNGEGGLFPLKHPSRDQTQAELWYQFQEYLQQPH